jgi:hypothetical protein
VTPFGAFAWNRRPVWTNACHVGHSFETWARLDGRPAFWKMSRR